MVGEQLSYFMDLVRTRVFQELTSDTNPLHYDDGFASKTFFGQIVVPGFYLISLSNRMYNNLEGYKSNFRFKQPVKFGQIVESVVDGNIIDYKVNRDIVVSGRLSLIEAADLEFNKFQEFHKQRISLDEIKKFLWCLYKGDINIENKIPFCYIASLISPALIKRGSNGNGFYTKISLSFFDRPKIGDEIGVSLKEINAKGNFHNLETICRDSAGKVLVKGDISIMVFNESDN